MTRDFYVPPAETPSELGDVIWVEPVTAPGSAWKVLYRSENVDGSAAAVSGWVAVSPDPGPHRILVVAHGTTGLGDACAPTMRGGANPFLFEDHLEAGWTVAFTDYQGLGTPGLHHYLVAEAAARSLLDVARTAMVIDDQALPEIAFYEFSQGGHAVLSAAELATQLAPELTVTGLLPSHHPCFCRNGSPRRHPRNSATSA